MVHSLTDARYLQSLLGRAGIRPERSRGQNFLICEEVVEAILAALQEGPKSVTELGAGVGTLTQALAASGFKVRAIEKDKSLIPLLKKCVPKKMEERLEVVTGDLRKVKWPCDASARFSANSGWQLVGNIPYNLSGLILRKMTQLAPAPERVVLLVQKEVGERLTLPAGRQGRGHMSLVGLAVQLWGKATKLLNIPSSCFWPEPKVDSQLVLLTPHQLESTNSKAQITKNEHILNVAKPFFRAKRKQMGGVARRMGWKEDVLASVGIDPADRPQEVSGEQWRKLAEHPILKP